MQQFTNINRLFTDARIYQCILEAHMPMWIYYIIRHVHLLAIESPDVLPFKSPHTVAMSVWFA